MSDLKIHILGAKQFLDFYKRISNSHKEGKKPKIGFERPKRVIRELVR